MIPPLAPLRHEKEAASNVADTISALQLFVPHRRLASAYASGLVMWHSSPTSRRLRSTLSRMS